ncbi:MAG: hypothetical protein OEZ23_02605 [Gammaproteobacteria bacterium]|nr:hypothetical protein [Gammaproteobacteria bacterium]
MKSYYGLFVLLLASPFSLAEDGEGQETSSADGGGRIYEAADKDYDFFVKSEFTDVEKPELGFFVPVVEAPKTESVAAPDAGSKGSNSGGDITNSTSASGSTNSNIGASNKQE